MLGTPSSVVLVQAFDLEFKTSVRPFQSHVQNSRWRHKGIDYAANVSWHVGLLIAS